MQGKGGVSCTADGALRRGLQHLPFPRYYKLSPHDFYPVTSEHSQNLSAPSLAQNCTQSKQEKEITCL